KPGKATGQVIIGNDSFSLVGNGLGPKLSFSYVSGGNTVDLKTNPTVVFSPVTISKSSSVSFIVKNTGTQTANIASISIGEADSPFSLSGLPPLPASLAAGKQLMFTITFTPKRTALTTGTLVVDTNVIALAGSGLAPPDLPSYTIHGPSGTTSPRTQASV